jgi:hypothetical protein
MAGVRATRRCFIFGGRRGARENYAAVPENGFQRFFTASARGS